MAILDAPGAVAFLADYWQKRACFIANALAQISPSLTADELAWLATLEDVEARLVFTEHAGDGITYRVQDGPFATSELESLPKENWTLLVHDVDKHLPDFRQLLAHADFVPDWRIDDLMISCAAPGGSVGPHQDSYDVFLCQGEGFRRWSIGDPRLAKSDCSCGALSLLEPFDVLAAYVATEGDVLYLPPGVPHWGVAEEYCMTYSIGMRAPHKAELAAGAQKVLEGVAVDVRPHAQDAERIFYADADLALGEADAGRISQATLDRVRQQQLLDTKLSDGQLARVFGSVVTTPKAWLAPIACGAADAATCLARPQNLSVHGMSRLAWYRADDFGLAFANGGACDIGADGVAHMQELCRKRSLSADQLATIGATRSGRDLFIWLALQGAFDIPVDIR